MRNILIDDLPAAIEIGGREYPIQAGFRSCLRTILAFEDDSLAPLEKQAILIDNLYLEKPDDFELAFEAGLQFLNGGSNQDGNDSSPLRLYSFAQDADYIFSAFQQTHGIDLEQAELHWWKFLALFMDLGSDTAFCNLVGFRKRIKTGTASKEELRAYREMRDVVDLPEIDTRTLEEREQEEEFLRIVKESRQRRNAEKKAKNQP